MVSMRKAPTRKATTAAARAAKWLGRAIADNQDAIFAAAKAAARVKGDSRAERVIMAAERMASMAGDAPEAFAGVAVKGQQLVEEFVRQAPSLVEDFFSGRIRITREPRPGK
jgi:hypothetical protein